MNKIKVPGELELYSIDSLKNALKLIRKYPQIYGYKAESKMNIILQTSYLINQLKEEKFSEQLLNGLMEDQNRKIILINEYIANMNTLIGLVSNNLNLFTERSSQQKIEIDTEVLQKLRANYFIRNATLNLSFTKDNKIEFSLQVNKDNSPSKGDQKLEAKPLSIKQSNNI